MKPILCISFFFFCFSSFSQNQEKANTYFDVHFFRGNIYKHKDEVSHLISGHPNGFLLSYNWKTNGNKEWHQAYNYPDYGISFHYIDFKNNYLGHNFALGIHYNFYFLKRNLMFRVSQGIGMTSHPYDKETNNKNIAFGTKLMDNTYFLLQYKKENIIEGVGLQTGFLLDHFSNGRIKSPNIGLNTIAFNFGINYNFAEQQEIKRDSLPSKSNFVEPIRYNIALRTGVSEGPIPDLGQRQFFHLGLYVDKRLGRKSALQAGTDIFFSQYLKDYIQFVSVAFPKDHKNYTDPNTDYKRIGLFVGHELFINKLSIETQLGYYVYKPFHYEDNIYQRVGLKYYLYKNCFTGIGLKTHRGRAEAVEATLGIRL
ncbi:MAG: deacylase [Flavobacterium sp.]|uniref:acyloxyacyl hydrolase n=1 Tax=Flavobacterium sp. TaxID=239 RepID=UPI000C3E1B6F|nr:acyloxyacyl hydrolase [Flavobacterium sp.]MBF02740.1 deacylase [Flavobacterium sp.]|tara:strand:+ start:448 stop:1554 length:1107 start_codon:yes stop_codon:yes gene_type:complete